MSLIMIFISLTLVIGVALLGFRIMNKPVYKRRNYSYSRRVRLIFTGYISLLFICLFLEMVVPGKETLNFKKVDSTNEETDLYNAALTGKINQMNPAFKATEWKFDYQEPKLMIGYQDGEFPNLQVVVEKKAANDHIIEAAFYRTRAVVNNFDITKSLNIPGLTLSGNQLTLLKPEKTKIKFSEFANVFSVNQFTGKKSFSYNSDFYIGPSLLYLKIPSRLQLQAEENLNIEYVK